MRHLLVTNDFPPKVGGIQAYLWELWRRLPADDVTVLTTPHRDAVAFDAVQPFRVVRTRQKWLLPTAPLRRQINALAAEVGAEAVVLDPILPLGLIGPSLDLPYGVVGHGAELVIPAKIPGARSLVRRVVSGSRLAIGAGEYVARPIREFVEGSTPVSVIPPGVDVKSFRIANEAERAKARRHFDVDENTILIGGVSRLVPRKGFDRLVKAAAILQSRGVDVKVLIAGKGRDRARLEKLILKHRAPARMLGRVTDEDLRRLYAAMDVFCMPCHDRWFGLEQEGFGIVFVEASSCGLPVVAGRSGGSGEAVTDGETGYVVGGSVRPEAIADAIERLSNDPELCKAMGIAGRARMETQLDYDLLAERLRADLETLSRPTSA